MPNRRYGVASTNYPIIFWHRISLEKCMSLCRLAECPHQWSWYWKLPLELLHNHPWAKRTRWLCPLRIQQCGGGGIPLGACARVSWVFCCFVSLFAVIFHLLVWIYTLHVTSGDPQLPMNQAKKKCVCVSCYALVQIQKRYLFQNTETRRTHHSELINFHILSAWRLYLLVRYILMIQLHWNYRYTYTHTFVGHRQTTRVFGIYNGTYPIQITTNFESRNFRCCNDSLKGSNMSRETSQYLDQEIVFRKPFQTSQIIANSSPQPKTFFSK